MPSSAIAVFLEKMVEEQLVKKEGTKFALL